MNEEEMKRGTGALESEQDPRTIKHEDLVTAGLPLLKGGIVYNPADILDQHNVGICTAISHIQNRNKANGKTYSADFQYLLQKKFVDGNWQEGSSLFSSLKVGKTYGYLPENLWTFTTIADRHLSYIEYAAKLQAVSDADIDRLLTYCVDKIPGYAQVNVSDPQAIATAIATSDAGILCRYSCQKNWWTASDGRVSWASIDIDPLRSGPETSGHAIIMSMFDYGFNIMQKLANTWSPAWDLQGCANINWSNYPMTEAWTILKSAPVVNPYPTLRLGMKSSVVKDLQIKLNTKLGCNLMTDGVFGLKTQAQVISFQAKNGLAQDGVVGPKTWAILNQ